MAVYPEGNPGAWPVDPTTPVGNFRVLYGDTQAEEYDPPVAGFRNFTELSDSEIENYIAQGGDSIPRGIGYLYLAMAGKAAAEARSVKDYDLQVDNTKRSDLLMKVAQGWFDRADEEDNASGASEYFDVVPMGDPGDFIPEGSPVMWGRRYTWERTR